MKKYTALNILSQPADIALGLVMKTAQAVGAYEAIRDWMIKFTKNNMLAGYKEKYDLEIIGTENIPEQGGAILAVNHQSWIDTQVLAASSKRYIHFTANEELAKLPLLNKLLEFTESVYLKKEDENETIEEIIKKLKEGWLIAIYPEGRIEGEEDGDRDNLQPETGLLKGESLMVKCAIKANVPIIPVGISGSGQAFPPEAYPRLEMLPLLKFVPITIRYGEPINLSEADTTKLDSETLLKYTDEIMGKISKLVDHQRNFFPFAVPIDKPNLKGLTSFTEEIKEEKAPYGLLAIHGFTSHINCVSGLEPYLKGMNLPYSFPILAGHGTIPHHLVGKTSQDWYKDAEKALLELNKHCEKVIVCALSMGGLVGINLAINHPDKISNVVLVAACLKFVDPLTNFSPILSKLFKFWDSPNSYNDLELKKERNKNYPIFATDAFASLFSYSKDTEKILKKFNVPVLILQAKKDQIVAPKSAEIIYKKISTPKDSKEIIWFENSGHEMGLDNESDKVNKTIADYIKKVTNAG
ncbi:MAG: alpha/beta hydrolase [Desulfobacterales bacterium]|nr:alpha/beta hydrolase [Desulfobacterales bacterium]MBF0395452.1 alpha/beta hydrolase [Desulfobacterales bacterium]